MLEWLFYLWSILVIATFLAAVITRVPVFFILTAVLAFGLGAMLLSEGLTRFEGVQETYIDANTTQFTDLNTTYTATTHTEINIIGNILFYGGIVFFILGIGRIARS